MLSVPWAEVMLTIESGSFERGTVGLCKSKGCKVVSYQIGGLKKNLMARPWPPSSTIPKIPLISMQILFFQES